MRKKAETKTEEQGFAVSISNCPYHLGYLGQRPKGQEIPGECMTCEKIMDCMLSKLQSDSSTTAAKPKTPMVKEVKEHVKPPLKEDFKEEPEKAALQEPKIEPSPVAASEDQFTVENLGMIYASWSSTVRIHKETIANWSKKTKEVEIETGTGKKTRCKFQPMEDSEKGTVQVPDKMQRSLGIKKGDFVKVTPITKS